MNRTSMQSGRYSAHRNYREQHHVNLAFIYIGVSMLIPISFAVADRVKGRSDLYWSYIFSFVLMVALAVFVYRTREEGKWKKVILLGFLFGYPFALVLDYTRNIEVLTAVVYIITAFQLMGPRRGLFWAGALIVESLILWILALSALLPYWPEKYSTSMLAVLAASLAVVYVVSWSGSMVYSRAYRALLVQTLHDPETGHPISEHLCKELDESGRDIILFVLARITNYHTMNQIYGSDWMQDLQRLSRVTLTGLGAFGLFRIHADTFAIPFSDTQPSQSQILDALEQHEFSLENGQYFRPVVRLGAAIHRSSTCSRTSIAAAMEALQRAETMYSTWEFNSDSVPVNRHALINRDIHGLICRNLDEMRIILRYQPVYYAEHIDAAPAWYEGLARIFDENGASGSIYPFLPLIESAGLLGDFTSRVIMLAGEFVLDTGNTVSVNVQLRDLQDPRILDQLFDLSARIPNGSMIIELLERDPFWKSPQIIHTLRKLRARGYRIALDDFGAGYSNLGALWQLELDIVKIDGELAKRALTNSAAKKLVESLLVFCSSIQAETVIEHIETEEAVQHYAGSGAQYLQGFHLGKPIEFPVQLNIN
ncbi:EAL domain-containing protein [Spirochaeta dissipatitropha]